MEKIFYKTIKKDDEFEIDKIKGSRFIGLLDKITTKEQVEQKLLQIKKKYPNATHYCYAYVIGFEGGKIFKFSDDGEPSGTAGKPILAILSGSQLTNIILTVVRYFGGVKLGTGGLTKAYSETARAIINHVDVIDVEISQCLSFAYEYNHTNLVMRLLSQYDASILNQTYDNTVNVKIEINQGYVQPFCSEMFEKSNGQISCKLSE